MNCSRCDGTGYMPYPHILNGICFRCHGTGTDPNPSQTPTPAAQRRRAFGQLADHLDVVNSFGAAQGAHARANLLALLHANPDEFVEALEHIKAGDGERLKETLRAWKAGLSLGRWDQTSQTWR